MPVGDAYAPTGDFEAEYRGAMEHAKSVVLNAVSLAEISEKVRIKI